MVSKVRITLVGEQPKNLIAVVNQIMELAKNFGMKIRGPIPMPRKALSITARRTPCGDGSDTYEHWEKRISKRLLYVEADEKSIRNILRIKVPDDVFVKISLN
ncbi:30S ribosomal protein S10 [Candidatus Micrarchaeota archaeon]|nr:30S ribosomal protein S10 [Candidatus Micrarchaeota archaeon]